MNIVYSETPFSTNSFHVETSKMVCFANHMVGFYVIWDFNEIYFSTEHNSNIMNFMSMAYFSIINLILVVDEI